MKLLLTALTLISFFGSPFAFQIQVDSLQDRVSETTYLDINFQWDPYDIRPTVVSYLVVGPSANEIALTAKIDSNEIQMNLLADRIDSMNRVQIKQNSSLRSLNRLDQQNKNRIIKAQQVRKEQADKSTKIISTLGVTTAIGAFFALKLFLSRNKKNRTI